MLLLEQDHLVPVVGGCLIVLGAKPPTTESALVLQDDVRTIRNEIGLVLGRPGWDIHG